MWAITGENQLTQTDWKSAEAMELSDKVIIIQLFQYVYFFKLEENMAIMITKWLKKQCLKKVC